jgi:amiloride-sensitive sodium channel
MNMEIAFQICSASFSDTTDLELNYTSKEFIKNLSRNQFYTKQYAKSICWKSTCNVNYKIDEIVDRVLTLEGFCTTFNLFDHSDMFTDKIHSDFDVYKSQSPQKSNWKLSNGYSQSESDYPHKMGTGSDLEVFLVYDKSKIDRDCFNYQRGYGIYWHLPNEVPTSWTKAITIHNAHRENSIELKVKSFKMSQELQKYDVKYRECYFDGEKVLKYFKSYTENNCKLECMASYIIEQCKCVPYYMPRDNNTEICRSKDLECVSDAEMNFETDEVQDKCKCYPPCNRIEYELYSREETELPEDVTTMELLGIRDLNEDEQNDTKDRLVFWS